MCTCTNPPAVTLAASSSSSCSSWQAAVSALRQLLLWSSQCVHRASQSTRPGRRRGRGGGGGGEGGTPLGAEGVGGPAGSSVVDSGLAA